jgi:hypothetical protein
VRTSIRTLVFRIPALLNFFSSQRRAPSPALFLHVRLLLPGVLGLNHALVQVAVAAPWALPLAFLSLALSQPALVSNANVPHKNMEPTIPRIFKTSFFQGKTKGYDFLPVVFPLPTAAVAVAASLPVRGTAGNPPFHL